MVRQMKMQAKKLLQNYFVWHEKKIKIKQFQDPRRVEIYETVTLTDAQKQAIDALYVPNYGKKVEDTWHKHFTAFTGKFDVNYFPEHLFIPEFEFYMNLNRAYAAAFEDKNILPMVAQAAGVKMPQTVLSCAYGLYKDAAGNWCNPEQAAAAIANCPELFVKQSVDSYGGSGCRLLKMQDGVDTLTQKPAKQILQELGENFVMQERLVCHESIAAIYPNSVNTFRVITYRWQEEIRYMPVIMRIGSGGSYLDNVSAGGMFIAVDPDGTLHDTAFTEFKKAFTVHPDSGLRFAGHQIPHFEKVLQAAQKMQAFVPQLGCINWDFTIDRKGEPVLIEANILGGSIDMLQMAHGCGPFGEHTAEVLRWIRQMKNLSVAEQKNYQFGKMKEI